MNSKIVAAINHQINRELYSSYLYLAMANYCHEQNRGGFAHWMEVQAKEEHEHGLKLMGYLRDRQAKVRLAAIEQPPHSYKSLLDVFEHVLAHEEAVTAHVNELYAVALKEKDFATQIELQWFIKEQVEEEKNATEVVTLLRQANDAPAALLSLDRYMAMRGK